MISSLRGKVLSIELDQAVVDVGGVGITVQATPATLATLRRGEDAYLHTVLVVREDALTLFGFADTDSCELFRLLQTVSGIGPRLALATLAVLEPDTLRTAIAEENIKTLTQVPGIGRKSAERLTLELRDKVKVPDASASASETMVARTTVRAEVAEALTGLGFSTKQSEQAVDQVLSSGTVTDTSDVLRAALTTLSTKR